MNATNRAGHNDRLDTNLRCSASFERDARKAGHSFVAGVDEVGRGSLFGSVFAAAVILDPERPIKGLRDSKELPAEDRERLAARIRERAVAWAVAAADSAEIDRINIYQATRVAMTRAVLKLRPAPSYLLVDAMTLGLPVPQQSLIKGDARCQAIAAASIIAKVERDACMARWDALYPEYGLKSNKGYSAPVHMRALTEFGPSPHHRFSYDPVVRASLFHRLSIPKQQSLFTEAS